LRLTPAADLSLKVDGPFVLQSGPTDDNLVLKAARLLAREVPGLQTGHFDLTKNLPAAAGLGGGSSDAAAALRLLARLNGLVLDDPRLHAAAIATGADVPVCLDPRSRIMRGVGDVLSQPLTLAPLHAVLVNPGVATETKAVFAAFDAKNPDKPAECAAAPPLEKLSEPALASWLAGEANDLESAAHLAARRDRGRARGFARRAGCKLARMSGSGATCFGLFDAAEAVAAAHAIHRRHPDWWVHAAVLSEDLNANSNA
jgi:4-diphosphocytidyl-2-C-methyl-D-erythritol kinase